MQLHSPHIRCADFVALSLDLVNIYFSRYDILWETVSINFKDRLAIRSTVTTHLSPELCDPSNFVNILTAKQQHLRNEIAVRSERELMSAWHVRSVEAGRIFDLCA